MRTLSAKDWLDDKDLSHLLDFEAVAEWLEDYGKDQYNQAIFDLAADDLLPDKEKNFKKYLKK